MIFKFAGRRSTKNDTLFMHKIIGLAVSDNGAPSSEGLPSSRRPEGAEGPLLLVLRQKRDGGPDGRG